MQFQNTTDIEKGHKNEIKQGNIQENIHIYMQNPHPQLHKLKKR